VFVGWSARRFIGALELPRASSVEQGRGAI
jgi:hypothetical protein